MKVNGGWCKRGLIALVAALTVGSGVSSSSVAAQEAAPVPPPPPTQEPVGLGTDGHLDNLASNCHGGSMQACDDLFDESPVGSQYELYGDTCAGRQPAGTGLYCSDAFLDAGAAATTVAAPAPPTTTAAPQQPTTDAPAAAGEAPGTTISDAEMFGVGVSGTGPQVPDCGPTTYVDLTQTPLACAPASSPLPPSTSALRLDQPCPIETDLESNDDGTPTFTEPSQMKTLLECILPVAVDWLSWEYYGTLTPPAAWESISGSLLPNNFLYVPTGVDVPANGQNCGGYTDEALHYCRLDGNIYLGEAAVWLFYTEVGDADTWGTIAHEMGHRVQHVANSHTPANMNEFIPTENQADCFSGAFMDYAARQGFIDSVETGDDLLDLFEGLFVIGEQVGEEQQHGTIDQRIRAFFVGYNAFDNDGVFACDFFVTDISIIPPAETEPAPGADVTTTVPGAVTPTTAAPTTLAPTTTAPTTAPAGIQAVAQSCGAQVAEQFAATLPEDIIPESLGSIARLAAENGVTVEEFVTDSVHGQYNPDTGRWLMFDPWEGAAASGDPVTEVGLIQGLAVRCGFNSIGATEAQIEQYNTTDSGEFAAGAFTVSWEFVDRDDGDEAFVIIFEDA